MAKSSATAEFAAAMRATAPLALRPEECPFEDPYARYFVKSPPLRVLMGSPLLARTVGRALDSYYRGLIGEAVLRCRYADDKLNEAIGAGAKQVVLLGAGYDSTSVRYQCGQLNFFEVDRPETQREKRAVLQRHAEGALPRITFVSSDLLHDSVGTQLLAAGLDSGLRAFISCLAVTFYVPRAAFERALTSLAEVTAPGSTIVFNYVHHDVITGHTSSRAAVRASKAVARRGEPWIFGLDPVEVPGWLSGLGWTCTENVTGAELAHRYYPDGPPGAAAVYISLVTAHTGDEASRP